MAHITGRGGAVKDPLSVSGRGVGGGQAEGAGVKDAVAEELAQNDQVRLPISRLPRSNSVGRIKVKNVSPFDVPNPSFDLIAYVSKGVVFSGFPSEGQPAEGVEGATATQLGAAARGKLDSPVQGLRATSIPNISSHEAIFTS